MKRRTGSPTIRIDDRWSPFRHGEIDWRAWIARGSADRRRHGLASAVDHGRVAYPHC